jgi:hypothetical protein
MNKKKKIVILLGLICCLVCVLINRPIVYVAFVVIVAFSVLNLYVFSKNRYWAKNINNLNIIGRDYDTLIIGEPIDKATINLEGNSILFTCPGRSYMASSILSYRLFSLLRPGGTLVITFHKKEGGISSLDIPFIHEVTLLEMGVNKKRQFFPLLFNPLQSLKFILGKHYHKAIPVTNDAELAEFCKSRNINLLTYQV